MSDKQTDNNSLFDAFLLGNSVNVIKKYAQEFPVLSDEELGELIEKSRAGNIDARDRIVYSNLRLILKVINHYHFYTEHLQFEDLLQEGMLGIMRAIDKYDKSKGAFSTYAWQWIYGQIMESIYKSEKEIKIPAHLAANISKVDTFSKEFLENNKRLPTDEEICDILGISMYTLGSIKEAKKINVVSMDKRVSDEGDSELSMFIGEDDAGYEKSVNNADDRDILLVIKEVLSSDEYYILYHRTLSDNIKTLQEIGDELGITRERVRQLESKAQKRAGRYLPSKGRLFVDVLKSIQEREGHSFRLLSIYPTDPNSIALYFYIRDELSPEERELYKIIYLSKYITDSKLRSNILGVSAEKYDKIYASLSIKIKSLLEDRSVSERYERYKKALLREQKSNILQLNLDEHVNVIDYDYLSEKYKDMSYEEMLDLFERNGLDLSPNEKRLIHDYSSIPTSMVSTKKAEEEINILIFGYNVPLTNIPKDALQRTYKENKELFTEEEQEWLECSYLAMRPSHGKRNAYKKHQDYTIEKLERAHYGIWKYTENNFTKKEYMEVRIKHSDKLSEERIKMLDLIYGVGSRVHSIKEVASIFGLTYIQAHDRISDARDMAIKLYNGFERDIYAPMALYGPYIRSDKYEFTEETRRILHMFVLEGKSYAEISELTGLHTTRISNIVTEGIRKIDYYRVGIIKPMVVFEIELEVFFEYMGDALSDNEKGIIRKRVLEKRENKDIAFEYGISTHDVNMIITKFNKLYYDFRIIDETIDEGYVAHELRQYRSESVLNEEQIELASFLIGFKNEYNTAGIKLSEEEIRQKYGYNKKTYEQKLTQIVRLLKGRRVGIITPELSYMGRGTLERAMKDKHLPLSDKEKMVICHLFELCGYDYKSLPELLEFYDFGYNKVYNLKRFYQRAIVKIFKYMNNEIDGILDYESDIVPILKYFGHTDREFIYDQYKDKLTYEEICEKHGMSFAQVVRTSNRIKNSIYDIMNNPSSKKFDFDYYLSVVDKPDFPFYGNKALAKKIMEFYYGLNQRKKMEIPDIIKKLDLPFGVSIIGRAIHNMMISTFKYKDGIRKTPSFSYEEIYSYYTRHMSEMSDSDKSYYKRYFEASSTKYINLKKERINSKIMFDLIRETHPDYFSFEKATRDDVLKLLHKYGSKIGKRVRNKLLSLYGIRVRELMNGKDINHVYRLLNELDTKEYKSHVMVMK